MFTLLRRLFSRRILTRLAFAVALLLTLLVALTAFENWHGRRAWAGYCAEADKRGVLYQRTAFLPPPVPDAENFASIPLFQEAFAASAAKQPIPDPFKWNPPVPKAELPVLPNRLRGEGMDFAKWQRALIADHRLAEPTENAARDTLTGLAGFEPALQELRESAHRSRSRFPVRWEDGAAASLPHLTIIQNASRLDAVRMMAHLALGDSRAAMADWRDGLSLYRALEHEPSLICGLLRTAIIRSMADAAWQGLRARQWAEPDLRAIGADLASLDLLADLRFALNSERGGMNGVVDDLVQTGARERGSQLSLFVNSGQGANFLGHFAWMLYPPGWARESEVKVNALFDQRLAQIDVAHGRLIAGASSEDEFMEMKRGGIFGRGRRLLAMLLMPALDSAERTYAATSATVLQARAACALEVFRMSHAVFPERLEELVPHTLENLPPDVMDGAPLRYRRTAEDGFVLWSIGVNRVDDGGKSDPDKNIRDQPDWVWRS